MPERFERSARPGDTHEEQRWVCRDGADAFVVRPRGLPSSSRVVTIPTPVGNALMIEAKSAWLLAMSGAYEGSAATTALMPSCSA
jgi:hypothetical protein